MDVDVILFAALRDAFGSDRVTVRLEPGATGRDLRARLAEQRPSGRDLLAASRLAQGVDFIDDDRPLDGSEVALIPPVSGG